MSTTLRACGSRVLVLQDPAVEQIGSIVLSEGAKEKPLTGTVVGVGPRATDEFEVGMRVAFAQYVTQQVEIGGETLLVMMADDVLAIIGTKGDG